MLNIQVLGKGLIPRGLGIAPRKEPFPADYTLIAAIMQTNGLEVHMINPDDGKPIKLTQQNVKRLWDKYGKRTPSTNRRRTIQVNIPEQKPEEKKEPQIYKPMNQNPDQYKEVPKDVIHETVQNAAATVFGNQTPVNTQPENPTDEVETKADEKNDETPETSVNTSEPEKKEEEQKPEEKKDNNSGKNNNGKNQPFKPINNPKQK